MCRHYMRTRREIQVFGDRVVDYRNGCGLLSCRGSFLNAFHARKETEVRIVERSGVDDHLHAHIYIYISLYVTLDR